MANTTNGNQFRDDEIIIFEQLRDGNWAKNIFPKIGGQLRLVDMEKMEFLPKSVMLPRGSQKNGPLRLGLCFL